MQRAKQEDDNRKPNHFVNFNNKLRKRHGLSDYAAQSGAPQAPLKIEDNDLEKVLNAI